MEGKKTKRQKYRKANMGTVVRAEIMATHPNLISYDRKDINDRDYFFGDYGEPFLGIVDVRDGFLCWSRRKIFLFDPLEAISRELHLKELKDYLDIDNKKQLGIYQDIIEDLAGTRDKIF